jgi:hypothetical protein
MAQQRYGPASQWEVPESMCVCWRSRLPATADIRLRDRVHRVVCPALGEQGVSDIHVHGQGEVCPD